MPPGTPRRTTAQDESDRAHLASEIAHMWTAIDSMKAGQQHQNEMMVEVHRAIIGSTDGTHKGIHRRLDGFESVVKDHEERIVEIEETIEEFDRIREQRATLLQDHDTRLTQQAADIQSLKDAKGKGLDRWWAVGLGLAGAIIGQIVGLMTGVIQASLHAPTKPPVGP